MARRVFFSFHYQYDIFKVNVVRNSHIVEGVAAAGFSDASLWEEAKRKGEDSVRKMIDDGLNGTSVTCVLIGEKTSQRRWVNYEIEASARRGNGLLGIFIDNINDLNGRPGIRGATPSGLVSRRAPLFPWDRNRFGEWVEAAYRAANPIR